ncbi:MAG: leucyl aminopeptidase family protein [Beijerinckiaceae bacterium]
MREHLAAGGAASLPVRFAKREDWEREIRNVSPAGARFASDQGFDGAAGKVIFVPHENGALAGAIVGLGDAAEQDPFLPDKLPGALSAGVWRLENWPGDPELAVIAFLLGSYRFRKYRRAKGGGARLALPHGVSRARVLRIAESVALARDLINTPANDLGPAELAATARKLAREHGAACSIVVGDALLEKRFPMIHAVGRASARAPRLVDIRYGKPSQVKVTLVGKGVVFDTGGLDIKPPSGMLLMKKDMGGAAVALAAARMIMDAKLPVRLRVLLPIVENAVGGAAFRPGDVLQSRRGLTVEIGNTDAEGRLILADALSFADEEKPDLLIDFATLTGAARVALGPDLPPFYTPSEKLAADIARIGEKVNDPAWRMPLWPAYRSMLDSKIADMNNVASGPFAGSIVAALFLQRFVESAKEWAHFDVFGWNPSSKPGRPEGGEAQAARLVYALVEARCATTSLGRPRATKRLRSGGTRQ